MTEKLDFSVFFCVFIFINPCAEKYYIFSVIYECTNITFFKIDINSIKFKNMRLI